MTSIIPNKNKKEKQRKTKLWPIVFWLMIWQAASVFVGQEILLASPAAVLKRLFTLVTEPVFWQSLLFSGARIGAGFLLGAAAGIAGAALAGRFSIAEELLTPLVAAVKAVPVASFVILILIWISSKNLSVVISFLMVFPILYTNTRNGLRELDTALLEMTDVFQVPRLVRLRWVILPQLYPYIRTGCSLSLGLCWKAGTAAEVIGIPNRSIGEHLYQAKIYLDTPGLFAWTAAIVYVSFCLEKAVLKGMDLAEKKDAGDEMREDTIEICHLKKAYGEHVIFSNLTMELKKGAVTCLMAPSGVGKTTLLRILAGLEQADGGKIGGLEALRKSMVFQEPRLAEELTAAANIQLAVRRRMFGKEKRSSRHLVEEMEELGLSGCENQAVSELSGGMRQRVAVLRAMRMDADFLLLDEPFRGLDAGTKKKTMNYIRRKGKEKTMLLVTHDLEEAEAMGEWICTCSRLDGILEIKRNRKSSTEI